MKQKEISMPFAFAPAYLSSKEDRYAGRDVFKNTPACKVRGDIFLREMSSQRSEDNQNTQVLHTVELLATALPSRDNNAAYFPSPCEPALRRKTNDLDVDIVGIDGTPLITALDAMNYWRLGRQAAAQGAAALSAQPAAQTLPSALGTPLAAKRSHDDADKSGVQASTKKGKTKCANDSQRL
jgi:hypothetical protein